jgi:hypothetical protein
MKQNSQNQNSDSKDPSLFYTLKSDEKLKKRVLNLKCENISDTRAVNIILSHKEGMLTDHQRNYLNSLINRDGISYITN